VLNYPVITKISMAIFSRCQKSRTQEDELAKLIKKQEEQQQRRAEKERERKEKEDSRNKLLSAAIRRRTSQPRWR